jgi:activator of HSP90 ATPase
MVESVSISDIIPASPEDIYRAYLDSDGHAALTGSPASIEARPGGKFSAWDGYITGTTLEMEPHRRVVQAWRTTEFPDGAADSRLELLLEKVAGGTKVTFNHSDIPEGQAEDYRQGWIDFYFEPMKAHFAAD